MVFRTLIIGLGNIGMKYDENINDPNIILSHSKAASSHPNFELIGAVDPLKENREIFYKKYSKENIFSRIQEIPKNLEIDIVIVSTPTETHLKVIKEIIKLLDTKIILCEKPLSYSYKDSKEIVKICKYNKIKLFVNYVRRCDPGAIEIKNKISSSVLEGPIKGVCWYSKGLYNSGSHFINLLQFWLGDFKSSKLFFKGRVLKNIDPEPDFYVDFQKGSIFFISAKEEFFSFYKIELLTKKGVLSYEYGGEKINLFNLENLNRKDEPNKLCKEGFLIANDLNRYQLNVFNELENFLIRGESNISTGDDALHTQKVMQSLKKN